MGPPIKRPLKHYFDSEEVFDRLKRYYNNRQYRFEVPPDEFENLRSFLEEYGYGLVVINMIEPFIVVVKNTLHTRITSSNRPSYSGLSTATTAFS